MSSLAQVLREHLVLLVHDDLGVCHDSGLRLD